MKLNVLQPLGAEVKEKCWSPGMKLNVLQPLGAEVKEKCWSPDVKLTVSRSPQGPGSGFSDEPPERDLTYDMQEKHYEKSQRYSIQTACHRLLSR